MSIAEIKKLLGNEKLIIGTDLVLKKLRTGKLEKVILSSNIKEDASSDIKHYAGLAGVKIEQLDIPNDELGAACKKPFSVSAIGILK